MLTALTVKSQNGWMRTLDVAPVSSGPAWIDGGYDFLQ